MSGFAQGLLAGFSTVDRAMTRRKELGLREAQLAQQQKNNERDFEFAQSQFEHNKDVDQRNFDYRAKVDDRNYALQEREFNANQNYRNASLGMEQQRLRMQKYNQRRLEYNDMLARDQPVMAALGKAVDAGDRDAAMRLYGQLSEGNPLRLMANDGYVAKAGQAVNNLQKSLMTSQTGLSLHLIRRRILMSFPGCLARNCNSVLACPIQPGKRR